MPRKKFYNLKDAVAMILEEDNMDNIDIVVLPPSHVDEQSYNEWFDENELTTSDVLPNNAAGPVEVHYHYNEPETQQCVWTLNSQAEDPSE